MPVQGLLLRLHTFWEGMGCEVVPSRGVGAAEETALSSALFFAALDRKPRRIAVLEGGFGAREGGRRLRVLVNPAEADAIEWYASALAASGIDSGAHDLRFVATDWTSAPLGLWGCGWHVSADALRVGGVTYLQEVGGVVVDPVSTLFEFELDPLSVVADRPERPRARAEEAAEEERYVADAADVGRLLEMLDLAEAETRFALGQGLHAPAYDGVLACLHLHAILEARGARGEAERASARVRDLTLTCAREHSARLNQP